MSDAFSRYHPAVNFLFFALVLAYSMVLMHPVCLLISLLGAVLYVIQLNGRKGLRFSLRFALPVMLLAAIVNPAFNHAGMTILIGIITNMITEQPNGVVNPVATIILVICILIQFASTV